MNTTRFLFRCDCDGTVGFGHLSRCLSLARVLREHEPSARISFWGTYDDFAILALARYGIERLTSPARGFSAAEVPAVLAAGQEFDVIILDTYRAEQAYVDGLRNLPWKLVVLDDMRSLDLRNADLVVSFRVGAEAVPYGARRDALGLGYLVVKPELRSLRVRNLAAAPRPINAVLVFFTGADHDPTLLRNAAMAAAAALPRATISYIATEGRALTDMGTTRPIAPRADIEELYANCDLIITGGGLVKYESAYCGIPNASLSHTMLQFEDTQLLAARNLTLDLGLAARFDTDEVSNALTRFVGGQSQLDAQRRAFRENLVTDSTERLAKLVLAL